MSNFYINRRDHESRQLETVDEFDSRKEARAMLTEYQISDHGAEYYISTRCTRDWRETSCAGN